MEMNYSRRAFIAGTFLIGLAGCGGGASGKKSVGRGRVAFNIRWPEPSRLIPAATGSLHFKAIILDPEEGDVAADRVLTRPQGQAQSTLLLEDLPSVRIRMNIMAHASTDGTGVALATGTMDIAVHQDSTVSQAITLSSRVTEVRVSPTRGTLDIGQAQRFTASAFDADGSLVVIRSDKWTWISILPAVATVAQLTVPDGDKADVSGLSKGATTITVTETESGVNSAFNVTVGSSVFQGDFVFNNQQELDSKASGVTEITGRLTIGGDGENGINLVTNLNALGGLRKIGGDLIMDRSSFTNLTDFTLPALAEITGRLHIDGTSLGNRLTGSLQTVSFPSLTKVAALQVRSGISPNADTIVSLSIPSLTTVAFDVTVTRNTLLKSVDLGPVHTKFLAVEDNPALQQLSVKAGGVIGISEFVGGLQIRRNPKLPTSMAKSVAAGLTVNGATFIEGNGPG